jgi:hypothetical protein
VPVCFILTSNRRVATYTAIFRCLNRLASDMNVELKPTTIICDFEHAFINAIEEQVYVLYFFENSYPNHP